MQILAFGRREFAVGLVGALFFPHGLLFAPKRLGLVAGEFARAGALIDALALRALTGVDAGVARIVCAEGGGNNRHRAERGERFRKPFKIFHTIRYRPGLEIHY